MSEEQKETCNQQEDGNVFHAFVTARVALQEMIDVSSKIDPKTTSLITMNSIFGIVGVLERLTEGLQNVLGEKLVQIEKNMVVKEDC